MTLGGWEEGRGLVQDDVAEMSDRFDAIRSAEMMGTPDRWPLDRMLPLRRMASRDATGPGSLHEHGHMLRGEDFAVKPHVYREEDADPMVYENFEAITDDGWRVD